MKASKVATMKNASPHFSGTLMGPSSLSCWRKYSCVPSTLAISGAKANRMKTKATTAVITVSGITCVTQVVNKNS